MNLLPSLYSFLVSLELVIISYFPLFEFLCLVPISPRVEIGTRLSICDYLYVLSLCPDMGDYLYVLLIMSGWLSLCLLIMSRYVSVIFLKQSLLELSYLPHLVILSLFTAANLWSYLSLSLIPCFLYSLFILCLLPCFGKAHSPMVLWENCIWEVYFLISYGLKIFLF